MYQALYRKWRPARFEDVVGQEHVTRTLRAQAAADRLSHAYLFCGPRGTGKTTCARILAKAAVCEAPRDGDPCNECAACRAVNEGTAADVFEMDAATYTGVDDIRALRAEAVYAPSVLKKKVYIIDEVHMLSGSAFNAFLKILEEPPEHVMFILASTELHKIPATVLSRCQRFEFARIGREAIAQRLLTVAAAEKIPLARSGASLIAAMADGAMRNALSLLEQVSAQSGGELDAEAAAAAMGVVPADGLFAIFDSILAGDAAEALREFSARYAAGAEPEAFCDQLLCLARDALIAASGAGVDPIGAGYGPEELMRYAAIPPERLLFVVRRVSECLWALPKSADKRVDTELCLYSLCAPAVLDGSGALASRVAELERRLAAGVPAAAPQAAAVTPRAAAVPASAPGPEETAGEKAPQAAPAKAAPAGKEAGGGRFASDRELIAALEKELDPFSASCLRFCSFRRAGSVLVIVTADSMAGDLLNDPALLDKAAAEAARLEPGITSARVEQTRVSLSGAAEKERDGMDELMKMMSENADISGFSR